MKINSRNFIYKHTIILFFTKTFFKYFLSNKQININDTSYILKIKIHKNASQERN